MKKSKTNQPPKYRVIPARFGGYIPQYCKNNEWFPFLAMQGRGKVICTSETIAWNYIKAVSRGRRRRGRKK